MSEPAKNGGLLQALVSSKDKWVQLATVALVVFSGGGNWFATQRVGDEGRTELQRALKEIHDIHGAIDESMARQKKIHENTEKILEKLNQKPPGT